MVQRTRSRLEHQGVLQSGTPSDRKSVTGKVGEGQRAPSIWLNQNRHLRTHLSGDRRPRTVVSSTRPPACAAAGLGPSAEDGKLFAMLSVTARNCAKARQTYEASTSF
jgi:hypothetical protein